MPEFFLAPGGNDANPGTAGQPVATIQALVDLMEAACSGASADVIGTISGDTHDLTATVPLTEDHVPDNGHYFRLRAHENTDLPLITDRIAVTGFGASFDANILQANIGTGLDFRHLFIGDRPGEAMLAPRSRFGHAAPTFAINAWDEVNKKIIVNKGGMPALVAGMEMVIPKLWSFSRLRIASFVDNGATYTITPEVDERRTEFAVSNPTYSGSPPPDTDLDFAPGPYHVLPQYFWLENSVNFLVSAAIPGSWHYVSSTGILYVYKPTGVTNAAQLEALGVWRPGALTTPFTVYGASAAARAGRLRFEGLRFSCLSWNTPNSEGFVGYGNGIYHETVDNAGTAEHSYAVIPAAVEMRYCDDVAFPGCLFDRIGHVGVRYNWGCDRVVTEGACFVDTAAPAVVSSGVVSNFDSMVEGDQNNDVRIRDCVARRISMEYGGDAFSTGGATKALIEKCDLADLADGAGETGIGGRLDPNWLQDANVRFNRVRRAMRITSDGAVFYAAANMQGREILTEILLPQHRRHRIYLNKVTETRPSGWSPLGLVQPVYLDLGSQGVWVFSNIIEDADRLLLENCTRFNVIEKNRLIDVDEVNVTTFSAFNRVTDAGSTNYQPPLDITDTDEFNGTGAFVGRGFQSVMPFANIAACFLNGINTTGGYATLSRVEDNDADRVIDESLIGLTPATAARWAAYLDD